MGKQNRKGCLGLIIGLGLVMFWLIFDFKDFYYNDTYLRFIYKPPITEHNYAKLRDIISTKDYEVTYLNIAIHNITPDHRGHIILYGNSRSIEDDSIFFYKLNDKGQILDSFALPQYYNYSNGYIFNSKFYNDWIITGDTTLHPVENTEQTFSREEFKPYYDSSTMAFLDVYCCIYTLDNKWYYTTLDFYPKDWDSDETFINKPTEYKGSEFNFYNSELGFESIPSAKEVFPLKWNFKHFEKVIYNSGTSFRFSNLVPNMSPTGVTTKSTFWNGYGYIDLKFDDITIYLKLYMVDYGSPTHYILPYDLRQFYDKKFIILTYDDESVIIRKRE